MSRRASWVNIVGVSLGLVAAGATLFSVISIFGRGPAAIAQPGRAGVLQGIAESVGGGVRQGLRAAVPATRLAGGWQSAEGEELVKGGHTVLSVSNVSGPIRVAAWDSEDVRVRYVKEARTAGDLQDFRIEILAQGTTVSVRPVYELAGAGRFGPVAFDISVPRRIERVELHSVSGEITVEELGWRVDKELGAVSGAITALGEGNLSAKTTSGAVDFRFSGDALEVSSISGRISGSITSLGPRGVDLRSVSGRVDVGAPAAVDATLDLRSLSGSIECDLPITVREQSRARLQGTVGKGTAPFSVSTTSGSIRIRRN